MAIAIQSVAEQLQRLRVPNTSSFEKLDVTRDFDEYRHRLASVGAFTLANSPGESFETFIKQYEPAAPAEVKGSNVSLARWAAEQYDCPAEVGRLFEQIENDLDKVGGPGVGPR